MENFESHFLVQVEEGFLTLMSFDFRQKVVEFIEDENGHTVRICAHPDFVNNRETCLVPIKLDNPTQPNPILIGQIFYADNSVGMPATLNLGSLRSYTLRGGKKFINRSLQPVTFSHALQRPTPLG